jgi:hypothetical protein
MEDFTCCLQKTIIGSNPPMKVALKWGSEKLNGDERGWKRETRIS